MLMRVELLRNPRMALVIPEKALISLREDQYVYVIKPGPESRVERRKVIIGGRRPGDVEVLDGLMEGERIVTEGSFKLQPGETVKVQAMEKGDNGLPELLSLQPNGKGEAH
jgi:membrane fusion protein (multidrug efflux system)